MSAQIPLDLPPSEGRGEGELFADAAVSRALGELRGWRRWPGLKWCLSGPEGSGKSHLARVWAAETGARVVAAGGLRRADVPALAAGPVAVEDVPGLAPGNAAALFHLHNEMSGRHPLLLTGRGAPARWPVGLADLASRIAAAGVTQLDLPSDELIGAVIVKLFGDRGVAPAPSLVAWLVPRVERDLAFVGRLVADLDAAALAEGRAPSRALAARLLSERAA